MEPAGRNGVGHQGPAYAFKMRGGLDAQRNLVALHYDACAADHNHLGYNEHETVLISQLMGTRVVPLPMLFETPLRTGNLRDPDGPQVQFALESFIDELATKAKADPVEFRLRMLQAGTQDDSGFKRALHCLYQSGCGEVRLGCASLTQRWRQPRRWRQPFRVA